MRGRRTREKHQKTLLRSRVNVFGNFVLEQDVDAGASGVVAGGKLGTLLGSALALMICEREIARCSRVSCGVFRIPFCLGMQKVVGSAEF